MKNFMEDTVNYYLPKVLKNFPGYHPSEGDLNDIKALALNQLKPHYVNSEKGELFTKLEELTTQAEVDVTNVLYHAIEKVKDHPREQA